MTEGSSWEGRRKKSSFEYKGEPDPLSSVENQARYLDMWEAERTHLVDMGDFVATIADEYEASGGDWKALEQAPRAAVLKRTVAPAALEKLSHLPIECAITDYAGYLHAVSGIRGAARPEFPLVSSGINSSNELIRVMTRSAIHSPELKPLYEAHKQEENRLEYCRFTLHNHPSGRSIVSSSDFKAAGASLGEIHFLVTEEGILPFSYSKQSEWYREPTTLQKVLQITRVVDITMRQQQENGIVKFLIPWKGDEVDQKNLALVCEYMNDPRTKWSDVETAIKSNNDI